MSSAQSLSDELQTGFNEGELPGLHSALVLLRGEKIAEVYFEGEDEVWGTPTGVVRHQPHTLHDLRSVTKSIVGLLYGIAHSEGLVPAPDAPLYEQFEQYEALKDDPARQLILISHVLSMQMGLEWDESLPYSDPRNSEIAMENAPDRYRFILEQKIVEEPGKTWRYSGGAAALIGKLIEDGTGKTLKDYAAEKLFGPLGIENYQWIKGRDGTYSAASGLRLTLPDLAKIGQMVADGGRAAGMQIVPEEWLAQSFQQRVKINDFTQYGYLWYLAGTKDHTVAIAVGNGGQRLTIEPDPGLVVASFAGRYNDPESWRTSIKVLFDYTVPYVRALMKK